ncbi:hypothetical protein Tco_0610876 [Tanacetum coccineum]
MTSSKLLKRSDRSPELPRGESYEKGTSYDNRRQENNHLSLDSLTKWPKEILVMKLQQQLPPCPSMVGTPKKENLDRYCDYHGEKGHYTNDCYPLKRKLKATLESGKLIHLVKDVMQIGSTKGRQQGNNNGKGKVIIMVGTLNNNQKCKSRADGEEDWMNIPITFPPVLPGNVSDETLSLEAEVEGYLKRKVLGTEKSPMVTKEVEEWVNADIVKPVWNLKSHVEDMIIKSKTEQEMIMDIAETFDNLRKINLRLNPKKCLFCVEEGKFLGYMVTSEGIRVNPKKTKAVENMRSPKMLKEIQSLSGKLGAMNQFLAKST